MCPVVHRPLLLYRPSSMASFFLLGSSAAALRTRGNQQHQALSLHSSPRLLDVGGTKGDPRSSKKGKAKGDDADDAAGAGFYSPRAKTVSMTEKDKPDMLDLVRVIYNTLQVHRYLFFFFSFFLFPTSLLLSSLTRGRFYPRRASGHAVCHRCHPFSPPVRSLIFCSA